MSEESSYDVNESLARDHYIKSSPLKDSNGFKIVTSSR